MEQLMGKHWHHMPSTEVIDLLETNRDKGLDQFEIEERRESFGDNVLTTRKGKGPLLRFLLQFHQPLIYILIVSGLITALLQEWVDAGVIFGVVLVNAVIGFVQESKAVKAMEALARTMVTEATVVRSGSKVRISSAEVVPGDVVLLQSGDKVPADLRLIAARDFQVDESALTGESLPVQKSEEVLPHDTVLADRTNMAYGSTLVTYGQATGVVVAIGDHTEVGRISTLISETEELQTPLLRKIEEFSRVLLYVILGLAALTFAVGIVRGQSALDMFLAAVALAVGAIPEGLPAALTITLAIGVARMARRRAIIRKLPAVETLGSTTVICSDKTGTLTENQMTVQEIVAGGEAWEVSGTGYSLDGGITRQGLSEEADPTAALVETLRCGLLCNDSRLAEKEGRLAVQGDPTEGALIVSAAKAGLFVERETSLFERLDTIPFESHHQYMATLHAHGQEAVVYVKGSVEAVLERSSSALGREGSPVDLDGRAIHASVDAMASQGLRVLAFARKIVQGAKHRIDHHDIEAGLTFLGLQGMIDPPRGEAVEAVKNCHTAGIRVKMITGDHALTASAIAGRIGLHNATRVLTGRELASMSDREIIDIVDDVSVYARVAPEQKLRLVEALQAKGNVVAMTGDGVNDAPALKRADIGVAMGITGTDVAKEASDMVLTDDNFASIEAAVEEGRGTYDNLTKFIVWTLPTNIGEGLVILAAVLVGAVLPILPVQILWINMTTAVLLGLMLVFEPKEPDIMDRHPRNPGEPILTRTLIWRIIIVGFLLLLGAFGLFKYELLYAGSSPEVARTVAVNVFVMGELFYLFNCRSLTKSVFEVGFFSNPWVFGGAGLMVLLQLLFTYAPAMNTAFHTSPIGVDAWARIVIAAFLVMVVVGIEKAIVRRRASMALP